ncbi:hypothetical protein ACIBJF_28600 [Streptomyces sp. NPDC050743]|uniref:hypothetical protein n=1 Tax=Streptomyces sp. NPDC050743 TaxID=3365634 RepID=UPI0037A4C603
MTRRLGGTHAIEAITGAADFDADLAERYDWNNRALSDAELDGIVERLAERITGFPPAGSSPRSARSMTYAAAPGERPLRLGHVPRPGRTARKP